MTPADGVADTVSSFVAGLMGRTRAELPDAAASGTEWLAVLRQWLAEHGSGLVAIAKPQEFSWAGHWIGIVDAADGPDPVAVLLFGTPSAVIASPAAAALVGKGVEELSFREGYVIVPFQPFAKPVAAPPRAAGEVVGIYVSDAKTAPMMPVGVAVALKGKGLAGDRYAAGAGTFTPRSDRLRGYDLTLVEAEVLEHVQMSGAESRRNLVTRGIDLNALVGCEFTIGSVRAFGRRLCEPCVHLERLTRPGVVAALVHKGGLRADILTDGEIRVGDKLQA